MKAGADPQKQLLKSAVTKYLGGAVLLGGLLFGSAGTFDYPSAWLFLALLFIPMLILGAALFIKAPELLEKRLNTKEKESAQIGVVAMSAAMFVGVFVLAGLDHRFGWSAIPSWLTGVSAVVLLSSYIMYMEVMRENAYLSRTVEVQSGQKVIDTGLYGFIRHPMYTATVLLFLSIPLVLGSWISFWLMLLYPILIVIRIRNEEEVLERGLDGYKEYKKRVRYRLIPFLW